MQALWLMAGAATLKPGRASRPYDAAISGWTAGGGVEMVMSGPWTAAEHFMLLRH